jgi:sorbitol-specific phosphotransferase system component IIC
VRSRSGRSSGDFPYVEQRLVACAATPLPLASVPLYYNVATYTVDAALVATFALTWFRHLVRTDVLRLVFCLAVVSMAQSGELVASVTNTGWFFGLWLILVAVARLPSGAVARAVTAALVLVATFSTPLAVVSAPLWFARLLHAAYRRRRGDALLCVVALAAFGALIAIAGSLGKEEQSAGYFWSALGTFMVMRVLADATVGEARIDTVATSVGTWVVHATALVPLLAIALMARRGTRSIGPVLALCVYGVVAASALTFAGHPGFRLFAHDVAATAQARAWLAGRYAVVPIALLYLAMLAAIDRVRSHGTRIATAAMFVAWLALADASTFVLPAFRDLHWGDNAARIERKLAERGPEPVAIPVNPDPIGMAFAIVLDGRRPARDVDVPPDAILGRSMTGPRSSRHSSPAART